MAAAVRHRFSLSMHAFLSTLIIFISARGKSQNKYSICTQRFSMHLICSRWRSRRRTVCVRIDDLRVQKLEWKSPEVRWLDEIKSAIAVADRDAPHAPRPDKVAKNKLRWIDKRRRRKRRAPRTRFASARTRFAWENCSARRRRHCKICMMARGHLCVHCALSGDKSTLITSTV